jgi:hypothetical protein
MHASFNQLLSLRDGEPVDAVIAAHVADCSVCSTELGRLATMRKRLQSLALLDAPSVAWDQISERAELVERAPRAARRIWLVSSAVAAMVCALALALTRPLHPPSVALTAPQKDSNATDLSALVRRSQQLEAVLDTLPQRPSVERVATAANIDGIEQRIQWLDFHMSAANDTLDEAQMQQLWRERVDLMDSLVKLRYVEARTAQL